MLLGVGLRRNLQLPKHKAVSFVNLWSRRLLSEGGIGSVAHKKACLESCRHIPDSKQQWQQQPQPSSATGPVLRAAAAAVAGQQQQPQPSPIRPCSLESLNALCVLLWWLWCEIVMLS